MGTKTHLNLGVMFVGLFLLAAAGLAACTSGGVSNSSVTSTSLTGTSLALPSTSTSAEGADPASEVLAEALAILETSPMDATAPSLLGAQTVYSYGRDGWEAEIVSESPPPGTIQPGPQAGQKGDTYFWPQSFEGKTRIVTATATEMARILGDKTVCWTNAHQVLGGYLANLMLFDPREQLQHMETAGDIVPLPDGGKQIQGTVVPTEILSPVAQLLGADWERTASGPPELYSAIIRITLDVDNEGAPTKMDWRSDAISEGQQMPRITVTWQRRASQPEFPLADSLPLATVVAEPWPTSWIPSYTVPAPQPTPVSARTYIKQQREYLTQAVAQLGDAQMRGLVTFKEPLDGATAAATVGTNNLHVEYLEWATSDGQRGRNAACVAKTAEAVRELFFPDKDQGYVRLVAVGLIGSHRDYVGISKDPKVLLVDLGPVPQLIPLIKEGKSVIGQSTRGFYWIWKEAGSPRLET